MTPLTIAKQINHEHAKVEELNVHVADLFYEGQAARSGSIKPSG